jgi:photosystem II stability/assembly factor-like uncharacterized protein
MGERILVGTRKGTFTLEKSAGRWRPALAGHAGVGVNFVARDPNDGTLWALLGHGHWGAKLSRSRDGGKTWADAPQLSYPDGARYLGTEIPVDEASAAKGPEIRPATLLKLWCIAFGPPGHIYVGTIPGGLFASTDGGEHFELNRPLWNHESRGGDLFAGGPTSTNPWFGTPAAEGEFAAGIHSIAVNPRDPKRILVAVSTAGVIETTDGGRTWRGRNKGMTNDYLPNPEAEWGHDPHYVELCPGQPDHVWQQNHSGVFYSSDGAATWKKVSAPERGVGFGFPVAADDEDGKVAWLVPGRSDQQRMALDGGLFVARTTDGGQSWEQQREGLPQDNAFDVVYRHALAQRAGLVAFGSTTGNLYVSENRGASWVCAGNNLPPIYSVRFG